MVWLNKLHINKVYNLSGFVDNIRIKGNIAFIIISDSMGKLQITITPEIFDKFKDIVNKLTIGSVIQINGKVIKNDNVKLNQTEMIPNKIKIDSLAELLPIDNNSLIDLKMDYRWIDLRSEKNILIWKTRTLLIQAFREFLIKKNFIEIKTPKILSTSSEGGAEVFEINYFGKKAFLAQSPQFYKQMAMASQFGGVFEIGTIFRSENSNTSKHATEFEGLDVEFSNVKNINEIIKFESNLICYGLKKIINKYGSSIYKVFNINMQVPKLPFPIMTLKNVYQELEKRYEYKSPTSNYGDLPTDGEKLCKNLSIEKFNHEFIFVTDYSAENRPFYHLRKKNIPQGYDLIWKGIEITTGAIREHRYNLLQKQITEKGIDQNNLKFYLDFFKFGMPRHGGFGMGIDRFIMNIFNISIKEAQFIFRGPNNLNP